MSDQSGDPSRHRFFKAMVVMGSGLALGCGGVSEKDGKPGDGNGGASNTGGSGTTTTGGATSSGGAAGTGGTFSLGGAGAGGTANGGAANGGAGGAVVMPNCPTTQWASPDYPQCATQGEGLVLPANSVCDPTRPKSADDCGPGQTFTCLEATGYADGSPLSEPTPYGCACVPDSENCRDECGELYSVDAWCHEGADPTSILCGCAIIVLK